MSEPRGRASVWLALLALAALLGVAGWWLRADTGPAQREERAEHDRRARPDDDGHDDTNRAADTTRGEEEAEGAPTAQMPGDQAVIVQGGAAPPRTEAPTRPRAPTEVDPCVEPERIERHDRLDELVNARLAELRDRARLVVNDERTSAALQEALLAVLVRGETELARIEPALGAPDRVQDGFDLAEGLLLTVAVRAGTQEPRVSERAIDRAMRAAPRDAVPYVLRAIRAHQGRDVAAFREALLEAFSRDREEPAIAIELAYALARTIEHARALDALSAYLAVYPGDPEALRLRARIERRRDGVGTPSASSRARGVTVQFPADLDRTEIAAMLTTVADMLDESARLLELPRRAELAVLVHRDHTAMLRAMCGQSWTAAAYDGVLHVDRSLFDRALTSERVRRGVLRHETLHAAIHERARDVPYWVDEGIAQHLSGLTDRSVEDDYARLVRDHTWVPLASLDGAFLDIDDAADARLAYHQSLAMIEWLVAQRGPRGLAALVARVSEPARGASRDPSVILSELAGRRFDGETLLAFLASR